MLRQGVQGISDLITSPGYVNLDFADVKTVMSNQGSALMGIGSSTGENRTAEATKKAISSPLLEVSIDGAENVLLNITGGPDLSLFEAQDASDIVTQAATTDVNIIFGTSIDESLGDEVRVTVIATGIDKENKKPARQAGQKSDTTRIKSADDPFDGWDMQTTQPSGDSENNAENATDEFAQVEKPDFNVFSNDTADETQEDGDNGLDTPPFFKKNVVHRLKLI